MPPASTAVPDSLVDGDRLAVDGLQLTVHVSPRRKRFALTVEMNAGLTLHVPQGRTAGEAEVFVRAHRRWVAEKVAVRERTRPLTPPKRLVDGEVFRYLGRTYRLSVDTERPADAPVRLAAGRLVLSGAQAAEPDRGRAALVAWYCRVGRQWAAGRLQPWAARMGVPEPSLDVADLGGRWGSYRPAPAGGGPGGMRLGWPLFQLPMHLVDYVVAHELAHVKVHGHGRDFWALLGRALPEYEERKAELDELGRRMWMGDIA
ncbi:M48 family metallopeptidase [Streptomyces sp. CC77]|uniref:M48 family metallopeptidase n=1 Tax=Streptomyces sp. CC77 TaxID=1906739 RepID=UPI000AB74D1D|nr:SprT family zinc-dependent metalloprotease [Streptomyces sp. CC77]